MPEIINWKSAEMLGLKRYFTGRPCKFGHVDERLVNNGTCFECARLKAQRDHEKNPERGRARSKRWALQNPIKRAVTAERYRERNRGKLRKKHQMEWARPEVQARRFLNRNGLSGPFSPQFLLATWEIMATGRLITDLRRELKC